MGNTGETHISSFFSFEGRPIPGRRMNILTGENGIQVRASFKQSSVQIEKGDVLRQPQSSSSSSSLLPVVVKVFVLQN